MSYRPEKGWISQDNQLAAIRDTEEGKQQLLQVSTLVHDLEEIIRDHQSKGIKITLAGDFNDNLKNISGKVQQWAAKLGLREVLMEKYGYEEAPATHAQGSNPIEGFFCTDDIQITKGGYIDRLMSPGDHSAIYVDIESKQLMGGPKKRTTKPVTQKLNSKIPSIQNKFRAHLEDEVTRLNLHAKTVELKAECDRLHKNKEPITQDVKNTIESLFKQIRRALHYVDKRCTKVRQGNIPYSREIRKALGTVMALQAIRARIMLKGRRSRRHTKEQRRIINKVWI